MDPMPPIGDTGGTPSFVSSDLTPRTGDSGGTPSAVFSSATKPLVDRPVVVIDTKNPPSKWWYAVAVIGTIIVIGGCGLGTVALVHSYQPFQFPPELDWLQSFIGTINTPGFWSPWVLTGGSAAVGSICLGSSIHQIRQMGKELKAPEEVVDYETWLHNDFSGPREHRPEYYKTRIKENYFVILPCGTYENTAGRREKFIPHSDGSGKIVVHEKGKMPRRTDKLTKEKLEKLANYLVIQKSMKLQLLKEQK